jgi:hypothetical protein
VVPPSDIEQGVLVGCSGTGETIGWLVRPSDVGTLKYRVLPWRRRCLLPPLTHLPDESPKSLDSLEASAREISDSGERRRGSFVPRWALPLIYCCDWWLSCCSRLFKGGGSVAGEVFSHVRWFSSFKTSSMLLAVPLRVPLVGVLGVDELRSSLLQVIYSTCVERFINSKSGFRALCFK